jgi:TrpR-related protein YerC/YecD
MKTHAVRSLGPLYEAIASIQIKEEAQAFFEDLCTPAELEAMNDRWQVIPLIQKGQAYRNIHEATGVSVTTIGRVARCLRSGSGGYQLILNRKFSCK